MQISRSEQKRRIKEVEEFVRALVTLPVQAIARLPYPDELKELIGETRGLDGSARQRQVKYLTKQLQEFPLEPLYALVGEFRGSALAQKKQMHALELYRDALIEEALAMEQRCRQSGEEWSENWQSAIVADIRRELPDIEPLALARLAYLFARTRNPRYSREIFRTLRSADEVRQRSLGRDRSVGP